MYCYTPFDLHVLGLPLAFILSQDQTLHCKIFLILTQVRTMSRAGLARIRTSSRLIRFRSFRHGLAPLTHLLFCLSPTFKEHVSLPVEVTWWAFFSPLLANRKPYL